MNIKMPDIYGHDGDAHGKRECIERIDAALGRLRKGIEDDELLAITGDHSTPVSVGNHTGDPLPILIWGRGIRKDDVAEFDEVSVSKGALGRIRGADLLPILLDLANKSEKFGA